LVIDGNYTDSALWPKYKISVNLFSVPIFIGTGAAGTGKAIALTSIVPKLWDSGGRYSFLFIVFKVLMVLSYLLGMFLFCCRKRKKNHYELKI